MRDNAIILLGDKSPCFIQEKFGGWRCWVYPSNSNAKR